MNFASDSDNNLCVLIDFKAQSGMLPDFTDLDENIAGSHLNYESQLILSKNNLQELGFPIELYSIAKQTNNFEFRLMELC